MKKLIRVLYILIFCIVVFLCYYNSGIIPSMFFYCFISIIIFSFVYCYIIYSKFKYTQSIDNKIVEKGQKVNFKCNVYNETTGIYPFIKIKFFDHNILYTEKLEEKLLGLNPNSNKEYIFKIDCKYRGFYNIGISEIEIRDFLGIFKFKYREKEPKYIKVYPKIIILKKFNLHSLLKSETEYIEKNDFEDMISVSDIREYRYGDNLKRVHWKSTAKNNKIMVKNYNSSTKIYSNIILDLKKNKYEIDKNIILEDKVIEATVAVIHYCLSNFISFDFVYYNYKLNNISAKTMVDFNNIYEILQDIKFNSNISVDKVIDIHIKNKLYAENIILCTSNINEEIYSKLYKIKLLKYDVILIYISSEKLIETNNDFVDNILQSLREINVIVYKIKISDDIKYILEN